MRNSSTNDYRGTSSIAEHAVQHFLQLFLSFDVGRIMFTPLPAKIVGLPVHQGASEGKRSRVLYQSCCRRWCSSCSGAVGMLWRIMKCPTGNSPLTFQCLAPLAVRADDVVWRWRESSLEAVNWKMPCNQRSGPNNHVDFFSQGAKGLECGKICRLGVHVSPASKRVPAIAGRNIWFLFRALGNLHAKH